MGRIQSNVGLASGINITTTIQALMKIASQSHDALQTATTALTNQQTAVTQLSALLAATRYVTDSLGQTSLFQSLTAASSNNAAASATVTGTPAEGSYQFTPLQTATGAQFLAAGVADDTTALGAGTLSYRFGNDVTQGASLDMLGNGSGFVPGSIRVTDRSGQSTRSTSPPPGPSATSSTPSTTRRDQRHRHGRRRQDSPPGQYRSDRQRSEGPRGGTRHDRRVARALGIQRQRHRNVRRRKRRAAADRRYAIGRTQRRQRGDDQHLPPRDFLYASRRHDRRH